MRAVSYEGPRKVTVSEHPKPKIKAPTDAILRITASGTCESGLQKYNEYLRNLIINSKAKPSKIARHRIWIGASAPDEARI